MAKESVDVKEEVRINPRDVPFWFSSRLGLALIGFLGFINVYAVRVNLSVAIVCMVNQTKEAVNKTEEFSASECGTGNYLNETGGEQNPLGGVLDWDKTIQGTILGSFFWGYLIGQVPAGYISTRFGGKWVFAITMLIASVATVLTPLLANTSYIALILLRVVLGLATGMTFPAMHTMWGRWAPPPERTKLMAFTYAGAQVGIVVTFPLSGMLCKYGFANGWPSIFYVTGISCFIWSLVWIILVSDDPSSHKRMSEIERDYILSSLKGSKVSNSVRTKVPWLSILKSCPVWAIVVANITSDWGAYTLLTNIPTYINDVLKFDITSNGLVSALPYIFFWIVINVGGWIADLIRNRELLTTGVTRKLFTSVGKIAPAVMLIALGYIDCSQPAVAVGLLVFAVSLTGIQYSGFLVNHVDIAPAYAGILFGISNSLAALTGFISPVIVGVITEKSQTRSEWQIVFYIAAAIYVFGALFFVVFASGELQPWSSGTKKKANAIELNDGGKQMLTAEEI